MTPAGAPIPVGYVRRAHGVRGDVVVRVLSDHPERFTAGSKFTTDESRPRRVEVMRARRHHGDLIVHFDGVDDRSAAEALQGVTLLIDAGERRPLEPDEFWPDQLEGLTVLRPDGSEIGVVRGVVLGAAQDRLVVTTVDGRTVEVPFVGDIVGDVDLDTGQITVDPPEGLV